MKIILKSHSPRSYRTYQEKALIRTLTKGKTIRIHLKTFTQQLESLPITRELTERLEFYKKLPSDTIVELQKNGQAIIEDVEPINTII